MYDLPAQFMNWRLVKGAKLPCLPDGSVVSAHDPAHWMTFDAAKATGLDVAFVFTADDDFFFLDLDKCRDDAGNWTPEAQAIYLSFQGALGEISTSGKGLHVIGKCEKSMLMDRKNKWDGWLEFYTQGRFVALTPGGLEPIGGAYGDTVDWTQQLLKLVPQSTVLGELPQGIDPTYTGPTDDDDLIKRMLASKGSAASLFSGKATVRDLWNATKEPLAATYPSMTTSGDFDHSSADAALLSHLAFWTGKDMPRMDRIFRRSALMRPKYEKRADYRNKSIGDAARMCQRVYSTPARSMPLAVATIDGVAKEKYLTTLEQIEYFKGCVYVRDLHKVMVPDGSLLPPPTFKAAYGGFTFQMESGGTGPTKNAFEAFTENRAHSFPMVKSVVFDPNGVCGEIIDNAVNVYNPDHIPTTPGDITPFLDFLKRLLPHESDRQILLAWAASVVQNPGVKFQWAPVLQGAEGNGKTFFMSCVAEAIGNKYVHRPKAKNLGEKFNEYVEFSLFVIIEEIHMGGRRELLDDLKDNITNEYLEIRAMQTGGRMARNFAKYGFCTNHDDAVIKSKNDRRYAIFFTAQQHADDLVRDGMNGLYFPELYNWAKAGGYMNVGHYLQNYDIPDHLDPAGACHRAPKTTSTDSAIVKSAGVIEQELNECIENGTKGFRNGWVSSVAFDNLLRERNSKISRNKRTEIIESFGYIRCPMLTRGRALRPIMEEDLKRPILFVDGTVTLTNEDGQLQYMRAQGYRSNE